jgi:RsiW-degrading membrane proteinase PrsW (M82 family)
VILEMPKKKKTFVSFMMLVTAGYAFWNTIKGISKETTIPIIVLLAITLLVYIIWRDED